MPPAWVARTAGRLVVWLVAALVVAVAAVAVYGGIPPWVPTPGVGP